MKTFARLTGGMLLACAACGVGAAEPAPLVPGYTIAQIFAEPGLTGYHPEQLEWSPDGRSLTYLLRSGADGLADLYIVDVASGKRTLLLSAAQLASAAAPPSSIKNQREQERITRYGVAAYHWSPKADAIFYLSNEQIYLYNLATQQTTQITHAPGAKRNPQMSPDEQWVSYVTDGDVHYVAVQGGPVHSVAPHQVEVLNGELNWVYTEELDLRSAYTWSPDSRYIAFLQSDERPVHSFPLINYLEQQPSVYQQKYPLAGAPNPIVRLGVRDVATGNTKWMAMAGTPDTYLARFGWLPQGDRVYGEVLNRDQTKLQLLTADLQSGQARGLVTQTDPDWIDVRDAPHFLKSGGFIWSSQQDGWRHLYLYSDDGRQARLLTPGDYNVLGLEGVDEARGEMYFTRYTHGPLNTELYRASLRGGELRAVTTEPGTHSIDMAPQARAYLDTYSNVMTPPSWTLVNLDNARRTAIQASASLGYRFQPPRFFTITAADGRTPIYARLTLPPDFDATKKYPVIMYQYGGPDAGPIVRDAWGGTNFLFDQLLARQGFVLFATDNRAATYFGHRDQALVKLNLGKLALADQLDAVNWLKRQAWVDAARIGIWGWSFGGYMTAYALTHAPGVWRAGIAVAPVTQWQDYDSIYTERYMGTPQENPAGYAESSDVAAAGNLADPLLLVAGTGDDNVHWQNTMQFIQALIDANKPYQLLIYPNKTHGISGPAARTHLFTAMQQFWVQQLQPQAEVSGRAPR
ncbi:MAG: DPP IV N-terminal domain-containing protein [Gammaproteobacteria bacterium]|nr:DPP IV N-terminal domain-containing protein [Gammaproteobacteria bacterium]